MSSTKQQVPRLPCEANETDRALQTSSKWIARSMEKATVTVQQASPTRIHHIGNILIFPQPSVHFQPIAARMDSTPTSQTSRPPLAEKADNDFVRPPAPPRAAASPKKDPAAQTNRTRAYAILVNDGVNGVDLHAVYTSFRHAVRALKAARLQISDANFVIPANAHERDNFPFRNKAGGICNSVGVFLGWGYQFRAPPRRNVTKSIWIKRTSVWHDSVDEDREEDVVLSDEEIAILAEESEIEYVAVGKPWVGRFDRKLKDFVFDS